MSPTLLVLRDEDLRKRKAELLKRAGKSVSAMRALASNYELDQECQAILRQIEELDFLLEG